jgi:4-amino-4-deoxy-L-arabinose transferase-like glycosyltransferase
MLFMALILLAAIRMMREATLASAALLGVACALEALVRAELILFVPTLLLPAAIAARRVSVRRRLGLAAVGLVAAAAVLAPWVVRNLVTFDKPTYLSSGIGGVLLGANCPQTYGGRDLGTWDIHCLPQGTIGDESVASSQDAHDALTYAERHAGRVPVVVLARLGRLWDFYQPVQSVEDGANEGRPSPAAAAGLAVYYALLPFALAGIALLRRRGLRHWFLLVPAGVLSVTSALFYGSVRFRSTFEVCLVVLAAPALVAAAQWLGRRGRGPGRAAVADRPAVAVGSG